MIRKSLDQLLDALNASRNAALLLGAGISRPLGIPLGYGLPMEFGAAYPKLLRRYGVFNLWQDAETTDKADWMERQQREETFLNALVDAFVKSPELQESLLVWLQKYKAMAGSDSVPHGVFVLSWLNRTFRHLITTNWDFVLEGYLESLYEQAFQDDPMQDFIYSLSRDKECEVDADWLFALMPLEDDEFAWNPRWDIVANSNDLLELNRWSRPFWKIHGSPFFLSCPLCRGVNRWKRVDDLHIGNECPEHPGVSLAPEIVFWGNGVDKAYPGVWRNLRQRILRCDMVVTCGFSGYDTYLRETLEKRPDIWVVAPDPAAFEKSPVQFVECYAQDLTDGLFKRFLKN